MSKEQELQAELKEVQERKAVLEKELEKIKKEEEAKTNVMLRVFSVEDACKEANLDYNEFMEKCNALSKNKSGQEKVELYTKVLNEGWIPKLENTGETWYYPIFKRTPQGLVCIGVLSWLSDYFWNRCFGFSLLFKSYELAEHAGKNIEKEYNEYAVL